MRSVTGAAVALVPPVSARSKVSGALAHRSKRLRLRLIWLVCAMSASAFRRYRHVRLEDHLGQGEGIVYGQHLNSMESRRRPVVIYPDICRKHLVRFRVGELFDAYGYLLPVS